MVEATVVVDEEEVVWLEADHWARHARERRGRAVLG